QTEDEGIQFVCRKGKMRKEKSFLQTIANARLSVERRSKEPQGLDISVDASRRYPKFRRQVGGGDRDASCAKHAQHFTQSTRSRHLQVLTRPLSMYDSTPLSMSLWRLQQAALLGPFRLATISPLLFA